MALSEFPRLGFDPFVELRRMQSEMNRLFSGFTPTTRDFPPINIWLGDNSVVVTSELPGVTPSDVTISLQEDVLTLEGARRHTQEQDVNWQRRERSTLVTAMSTSFSRTRRSAGCRWWCSSKWTKSAMG